MGKIYTLIQDYRGKNPDAIVEIIETFNPLLNKLQRNASYEDLKNDLIVFMFKLAKQIPLDRDVFKEEKYLISYIHKSLNNHYIYLNKKNCYRINRESNLEEMYNISSNYNDYFSNTAFTDIIKVLSESERDIVKKKYVLNYSEAEIARMYGISRQAIHKKHVRALDKLRKIYNLQGV